MVCCDCAMPHRVERCFAFVDLSGFTAFTEARGDDEAVALLHHLRRAVRDAAELHGVRVGVLEGDVQGSMDADRLASLHVPVTQLNTDSGFGGECHLDANMVRSAMPALPLHEIDLLVIENVGNLVCQAEFRVGEDVRAMVCSVTEGEDKPLKYPLMFRACELVLVNKIDLLAHLDYELSACARRARCDEYNAIDLWQWSARFRPLNTKSIQRQPGHCSPAQPARC